MTGSPAWFLPFALQALVMGVDELYFHRRREVPRWEWLGHLLDTSVFLACLACAALLAPRLSHLRIYGALAVLSCLIITKDEWVHQRLCTGGEHWVHAVLFILHPIVLLATGLLWLYAPALSGALGLQAGLVAGFLVFQALAGARSHDAVDNTIYEELGERWYEAQDDPVALLRAEARLRTGWVLADLAAQLGPGSLAILDVACGGGFLANPLAAAGHAVTGIDLSPGSLEVARRHDGNRSVTYLTMDARSLAFPDGRFDAVCMMDFLEHLEERDEVIREAARVLRPGGCFYFHTFNRTPLAWLIGIKGVAWAVRNTPRNMHVLRLFLKPRELRALCQKAGLAVEEIRGVRPLVGTAFLWLLLSGRVSDGFRFAFTRSQAIGYCGRARKADRKVA
jgi:2-polyprenyl-6-hydroxyphenyl methylase/3-demethylubiquinone-9 3-methyltransferase